MPPELILENAAYIFYSLASVIGLIVLVLFFITEP